MKFKIKFSSSMLFVISRAGGLAASAYLCAASFFLFYLCLSSSMIYHNWPIGQRNGAQVFTLAVPGLALFVVCSSV